jgi:ketosteroid isomerase-like protein
MLKPLNKIFILLIFAFSAFFASCSTDHSESKNTASSNQNSEAERKAFIEARDKAVREQESKIFDAYKNNDKNFWASFLSDDFQLLLPAGRIDKAEFLKGIEANNCKVNDYSLADEKILDAANEGAIYIYKAKVNATCEGEKLPEAEYWAASVYRKNGESWSPVFHSEVSTNAALPPEVSSGNNPADSDDALTKEITAQEQKLWDAWKARDAKAFEALLAENFVSLDSDGIKSRQETIKSWTEPKCNIKSALVTAAEAIKLGENAVLLTFRSDTNGTCNGTPLLDLWAASLYLKTNEGWKSSFYMHSL